MKRAFEGNEILLERGRKNDVTTLSIAGNLKIYESLLYDLPMFANEFQVKIDDHFLKDYLEVYKGPEFELLSDAQLHEIFTKTFTVSKENNRMAYQLSELIEGHAHSMLTSGTLPGTIQLTPAGRLIILMKDGQTTRKTVDSSWDLHRVEAARLYDCAEIYRNYFFQVWVTKADGAFVPLDTDELPSSWPASK